MRHARSGSEFVIERLEERRLLAGITIITHGWNGTTTGWVSSMADAIAGRIVAPTGNIADVAQYTITAVAGSPVTIQSTVREEGPANWGTSGEAIIKFNWSSLAGGLLSGTATGVVADALANYLFANTIDGHSVFEVPVHLIGHSRGASLMVELAKRLAEHGVWVDQFTSLDPHPVDGVREPFPNPNFGDTPMTLWDNVVFADNYWHTDGDNSFDFTGEPVTGARNLGPLSLPGGGSTNHSDVHAYYYGTIDRNATSDNDGITLNDAWYAGNRDSEGYDRARLGHGTPWIEGVSSLAGGSAVRTHVTLTTSPWSNVGGVAISGGSSGLISNGDNVNYNFRYQDISGGGTVSLYLDNDTSPYDGFARSIGSVASLTATGATPAALSTSLPGVWTSAGLTSGLYYVYAAITDSGAAHTRYAYMNQPLFVQAGGAQMITNQWIADISSLASDPGNWAPGGVPGAGSRTLIAGGNVAIDIGLTDVNLSLLGSASATFNITQHLRSLTMIDSTLGVLSAGGNTHLVTGILSLAGNATIDLNDHALIVDYAAASPATDIRNDLLTARNGGAWNGIGLRSSAVTSHPGTTVGYAEASAIFSTFPGLFAGESVDSTAILIAWTINGDANLDQKVDINDLGHLAANLGGTNKVFSDGDFNYDGNADSIDLGILASHWQQTLAALAPAAPSSSILTPPRRAATRVVNQVL